MTNTNNFKLKVLRVVMIAVLSIVYIITGVVEHLVNRYSYHYPVKWLLHFLLGSGKSMRVPDRVIRGTPGVFGKAMDIDAYGTMSSGNLYGKYCVNHSTLYSGQGFKSRPTLFYLCGGFTFKVYPLHGRTGLLIAGTDTYDWHSDGSGRYFTSPLGSNPIIKAIVALGGMVFGKDLMCVGVDFDTMICAQGEENQARISNKLWESMYLVGAKDFQSWFRFECPLSKSTFAHMREVVEQRYYEADDWAEDEGWPEYDDYDYEEELSYDCDDEVVIIEE